MALHRTNTPLNAGVSGTFPKGVTLDLRGIGLTESDIAALEECGSATRLDDDAADEQQAELLDNIQAQADTISALNEELVKLRRQLGNPNRVLDEPAPAEEILTPRAKRTRRIADPSDYALSE